VNQQRPLSVLVVDDQPLVRASIAEMLATLGHTVIEASSGEEAMARLGAQPPDLLITDYRMPGITGLELIEWVRSIHPTLPLFVVSGYDVRRDADELQVEVLSKPFGCDDLVAVMRRVLGASAVRTGTAET
jgi:CheY-like chemotaxis protein